MSQRQSDQYAKWQLIFKKPFEPIFTRTGTQGERFRVPKSYKSDRYESISEQLISEYSERQKPNIAVKDIPQVDISFAKKLSRNALFSPFIPMHYRMAAKLIDILMRDYMDLNDLMAWTVCVRDDLNPYLLNYVLSIVILNRTDLGDLELPSHLEVFPDKYIPGEIFRLIREQANIIPKGSRTPILVPTTVTATNLNDEQRCAYFREDISLNLCYWNWNVLNPANVNNAQILGKKARGELYYFFHQQILARYNCERLCNQLFRAEELVNLREPIQEACFPKINLQIGDNTYPPRFKDSKCNNLNRECDRLQLPITTVERWIERIVDSIEMGYAVTDLNKKIALNNQRGIDCIANIVQSSNLSPNRNYYGDLANSGHLLVAYCHDYQNRYNETHSIMADFSTCCRDPVFYRWHAFLKTIFDTHKGNLVPYKKDELAFPGIELLDASINYQNERDGTANNEIRTFWQQEDINPLGGLNFTEADDVFLRITYLQHSPFLYKIKIKNSTGRDNLCVVRIYLAPVLNEWGKRMRLSEQRHFMILLDKFVTNVKPGTSVFIRRSDESNVTTSEKGALQHLFKDKQNDGEPKCMYGWPAHLLVPKGDEDGIDFDLFVCLSHCQDSGILAKKSDSPCKVSSAYFRYGDIHAADGKPLGFPLDREFGNDVEGLYEFLLPNMKATPVCIRHENIIQPPTKD